MSIKKAHSYVTLSRNASSTKLGKGSKAKTQAKAQSRKRDTDDLVVVKGGAAGASFEFADEDDDDEVEEDEGDGKGEYGNDEGEWTEYSSSPYTTRQSSTNPSRPKTPITRDGPPPEEGERDHLTGNAGNFAPLTSSNTDGQSSPPSYDTAKPGLQQLSTLHANGSARKPSLRHSHPPDAEALTHRLLNRGNDVHSSAVAQTSVISANITPPRIAGSPAMNHTSNRNSSGTASNPNSMKEPSMPADGISRFLDRNSADSAGATPGSVSYLQSNLANLNHGKHSDRTSNRAHDKQAHNNSKQRSGNKMSKTDSRRVQSAANLTHSRLDDASPPQTRTSPNSRGGGAGRENKDRTEEDQDAQSLGSPHLTSRAGNKKANGQYKYGPSPFESARATDPNAGKSLTQLRIDLTRLSTQRAEHQGPGAGPNGVGGGAINGNTLPQQPTQQYGYGAPGTALNMTMNILAPYSSGEGGDMAARVARQWESGRKEVSGLKKFWPEIVRGRLLAGGGTSASANGYHGGYARRDKLRAKKLTGAEARGVRIRPKNLAAAAAAAAEKEKERERERERERDSAGQESSPEAVGPPPASGPGSGTGASRGRVRFEVGRGFEDVAAEDREDKDGDGDGAGAEDVEGLLRRMWVGGDMAGSD